MFSSMVITLLGKALKALTTTSPPTVTDDEHGIVKSDSDKQREFFSDSGDANKLLFENDDELEVLKQDIEHKLDELHVQWMHWTIEVHIPPPRTGQTTAHESATTINNNSLTANPRFDDNQPAENLEHTAVKDHWAYRSFNSGKNLSEDDRHHHVSSSTDYVGRRHEEAVVVCWNVDLNHHRHSRADDSPSAAVLNKDSVLSSSTDSKHFSDVPRATSEKSQGSNSPNAEDIISNSPLFVVLTISVINSPVHSAQSHHSFLAVSNTTPPPSSDTSCSTEQPQARQKLKSLLQHALEPQKPSSHDPQHNSPLFPTNLSPASLNGLHRRTANKLAKSFGKKTFLALLDGDDDNDDHINSSSSSPLQQHQRQQRHKRSKSEATVAGVFHDKILSWRNSLCESLNYNINRRISLAAAASAAGGQQPSTVVPDVFIDVLPSSPSTVAGSNSATPTAKQKMNGPEQMASEMNLMHSLVQLLARLNDSTCTQCQIEIAEFLKKHINAEEAFWLLTLEDSEELCCQVLRGTELGQWLRFDIKGEDLPDITPEREQPILVSLDGLNVQIKREIARELGREDGTPYAIRSAMCMPLMKSEYYRHRGLLCVINKKGSPRFTIEDSKLLHMVIKACSGTLLSKVTVEQRSRVTEALLRVAKVLFTNLEDVNELVGNILCEAKRLTNAERCSLFLVDKERGELVAKVFDGIPSSAAGLTSKAAEHGTRSSSSAADESIDEEEDEDNEDEERKSDEQTTGSSSNVSQRPRTLRTRQILRTPSGSSLNPSTGSGHARPTGEVRIALGRGVAGHVAVTGEILNIKDAYTHPLFYSGVDQSTGFKTRSILCFPIKVDKREQQQQQQPHHMSSSSAPHSAATSTASNASLLSLQQQAAAAALQSLNENARSSSFPPRVTHTSSSTTTTDEAAPLPSRRMDTSLLAASNVFDSVTEPEDKDDDDFFDGTPSTYILSPSATAARRRHQKPQRRVSVLNVLGGSVSPSANKMKLVTGEEINSSDDIVDDNKDYGPRGGGRGGPHDHGESEMKLFSLDDMFSEKAQQQQQQQRTNKDGTVTSGESSGIMSSVTTMRQCELVGVAQLCNKLNGSHFTQFDEELAKAFSMFCGISIIHNIKTGAVNISPPIPVKI